MTNMPNNEALLKTLHVDLGDRSYPIFIGSQLLDQPDLLRPYIKGNSALIVTNETIAPLYLDKVTQHLDGIKYSVIELPDGEAYKNIDTLNSIYTELLTQRLDRTTTLIALGGGVVGDITGYAAASYQRGVNFIQIPTTLLSQVDSSVGGKTAVNHPLGKNMIGAFHQPQCVIADIDTLNTLPRRELSAGIAEVIKYGILGDLNFFEWLEHNIDALMALDADKLIEAVQRSCQNKADIVAADEKESGQRALLNLGHTFGHAIETHMGYGKWLHGEAVGTGMIMAAELSAACDWISTDDLQRISKLIARGELPTTPPNNMTADDFLAHMSRDKKVLNGVMRLVLIKAIGQAVISSDYPKDKLMSCLPANNG